METDANYQLDMQDELRESIAELIDIRDELTVIANRISKRAATIKKIDQPKNGDCDICGEWSGRLSEGICDDCSAHYL